MLTAMSFFRNSLCHYSFVVCTQWKAYIYLRYTFYVYDSENNDVLVGADTNQKVSCSREADG